MAIYKQTPEYKGHDKHVCWINMTFHKTSIFPYMSTNKRMNLHQSLTVIKTNQVYFKELYIMQRFETITREQLKSAFNNQKPYRPAATVVLLSIECFPQISLLKAVLNMKEKCAI